MFWKTLAELSKEQLLVQCYKFGLFNQIGQFCCHVTGCKTQVEVGHDWPVLICQ